MLQRSNECLTMSNWAAGRNLDAVLADLRTAAEVLVRTKLPGELPPVRPQSCSAEEIRLREKQLGREIPAPIKKLYSVVDGIQWHSEPIQSGITTILRALSVAQWVDPEDECELIDLDNGAEIWKRDDYFRFAQTTWGCSIVYCENPPGHVPGSIILLDALAANKISCPFNDGYYTPIVFLADSLQEWLARWMACGFEEYGQAVVPAWELSQDVGRAILEDHIRLNPTVVWAKEELSKFGEAGSK